MYHRDINFYLIGNRCNELEIVKKMAPLDKFRHKFEESSNVEVSKLLNANVIILNLVNVDTTKLLSQVLSNKKETSQLIVLTNQEGIISLGENIWKIKDIWLIPMLEQEIEFRFRRWQESYKLSKDFWQSTQYLEAAIDTTPNLVWFKNKDGVHEKVNNSFCNIVNKSKQQIEGKRHAFIWGVDEDDPACIASEEEVMLHRKALSTKEFIRTGEGEKEFDVYKAPLYDIDGSVMGTVGVAIDVTKEQLYRKDLIKRSETLEKVFTTLDCGVIRHSMDGKTVMSINEAALNILGYATKEALLQDGFHSVSMSVVEEDKTKLYNAISSLQREGDSVSVEYKVRHKDGKLVYVMGNIKLLKENGEYLYQRFLLDCTFQKVQENKEKRQYSYMIQALSVGYDLVCYFGTRKGLGKTIQINELHKDRFGDIFNGNILLEESMRHYIDKFVCDEDKNALKEFFQLKNIKEILKHEASHYVTYRVNINGKLLYYQIKLISIKDLDGGYNIVIGFRCVDEEIRSEMEQKKALEEMLEQVQKANEAKTTFLSNMSHDIRTPMNAILGFTSLALNNKDDINRVMDYLLKIKSSGTYMLNLLNNILDMSYIESGKIKIHDTPNSLTHLVNNLENSFKEELKEKDLTLTTYINHLEHDKVYYDKLRLKQIFFNLLSNAIKYTNKGGKIDFTVSEDILDKDDYGNYEFRIKDNGIGMSQEFLNHIFEPFEREKNTTMSGISGTGLGLSITKNIVDNMNGIIEVKSVEGKGSEFIISFIFRICTDLEDLNTSSDENTNDVDELIEEDIKGHPEAAEKEKSTQKNTNTVDKNTLNLSDCRILLVEDNELNQEIAVAILEDEGYIVEVANNGQIAVDMISKSSPGYYKIVLMDIQMPVMNGYEATEAIRKLENKHLSSIPILAMTANAFEEDKQKALRSSMTDFISKPIDTDYLFTILKKILL